MERSAKQASEAVGLEIHRSGASMCGGWERGARWARGEPRPEVGLGWDLALKVGVENLEARTIKSIGDGLNDTRYW